MPATDISDRTELEGPDQKKGIHNNDFESKLCNGRWLITNFNDGNVEMKTNHTNLFRDYIFEFTPNDVVIARGPERNVTGKWNTVIVGDKRVVVLSFGFKPFVHLNAKWTVSNYNHAVVDMNVSRSGGTAMLRLESAYNMPK
jgi:hypothetical protein